MTDLMTAIKHNCVYSRLSDEPLVARYGDMTLVFINGFPMTARTYYVLFSKAIFGGTVTKMSPALWSELNAEIHLLCQGTGHDLKPGHEAQQAIQAIRRSVNWTKDSMDSKLVHSWVEGLDKKIQALSGSLAEVDNLNN
jgi:hypothetical protein